jgi:hypothetical protein
MAVGLPILASDLPAQRSLIEKSGSGVVVGGSTPATIVLQNWLNNPNRGLEIGEAGNAYYQSIAAELSVPQTLKTTITGQ